MVLKALKRILVRATFLPVVLIVSSSCGPYVVRQHYEGPLKPPSEVALIWIKNVSAYTIHNSDNLRVDTLGTKEVRGGYFTSTGFGVELLPGDYKISLKGASSKKTLKDRWCEQNVSVEAGHTYVMKMRFKETESHTSYAGSRQYTFYRGHIICPLEEKN